eukprot:5301713-Prymnesium_polylepis.4
MLQRDGCSNRCKWPVQKIRTVIKIYRRAGMRYKVKVLVGLYQCISAVPSVFDVTIPPGLETYADLVHVLEWPSSIGMDVFVSADCLGSYQWRLLAGSCWPLVLLATIAAMRVGWELLKVHVKIREALRCRKAVYAGIQRSLPLTLGITFILVPSTATLIFKTFLCDPFEFNPSEVRRYLHEDLALGTSAGTRTKPSCTVSSRLTRVFSSVAQQRVILTNM